MQHNNPIRSGCSLSFRNDEYNSHCEADSLDLDLDLDTIHRKAARGLFPDHSRWVTLRVPSWTAWLRARTVRTTDPETAATWRELDLRGPLLWKSFSLTALVFSQPRRGGQAKEAIHEARQGSSRPRQRSSNCASVCWRGRDNVNHHDATSQDNSGTIEREEFLSLPQINSNPLATRCVPIPPLLPPLQWMRCLNREAKHSNDGRWLTHPSPPRPEPLPVANLSFPYIV